MTYKKKRFVVQEHTTADGVHWDLMLEINNALKTYRLDKPPGKITNEPANAEQIFDHPLKFLTYEGLVNQGKGNVRLIESGTYTVNIRNPKRIVLEFNGSVLIGDFILTEIDGSMWELSIQSASL